MAEKILILEDDLVRKMMVSASLDMLLFDKEVVAKAFNKNDLNEMMVKGQYSLIIISVPLNNESDEAIYLYDLLQKGPAVPVMFMYKQKPQIKKLSDYSMGLNYDPFIKLPIKPKALAEVLKKLFKDLEGQSSDESFEIPIQSYFPLRSMLIKKVNQLPCDLYIKINDEKYIKLAHKDSVVDRERIEKYESKSLKYFHLKLEDYFAHYDKFFEGPLVSRDNINGPEDYALKTNELIHDFIKEVGITDFVFKQAQESVVEIAKDIKSYPIANLFDMFGNLKKKFIYDHSFMTSVFAAQICEKMDWSSEKTIEKLTMAAMFHDLGYKHDELAYFENDPLIEINSLSSEKRDEILLHGRVVSDELKKIPTVPEDVITLITNHHEGRGEESYPRKIYASNLSAMQHVFNLAHDFSIELFRSGYTISNPKRLMEKMKIRFPSAQMKKSLDVLEEIITKNQK